MDEPQAQATSRVAVLMPALVPGAFDYLAPEGTVEGALVEAPLAGRSLIGVVWEGVHSSADAQGVLRPRSAPPPSGSHGPSVLHSPKILPEKKFKLKPVMRVIERVPPLSAKFRKWIDWVAEFTLAPKGAVLSLCGLAHAAETVKKAQAAQKFAMTLPVLTDAQAAVAMQLVAAVEGSSGEMIKPILLDGVTGSGKTEVYFHALAAAIEAKAQVLVLLPEIALTHQWLARFERVFGATPVVWHSRMTPGVKARRPYRRNSSSSGPARGNPACPHSRCFVTI